VLNRCPIASEQIGDENGRHIEILCLRAERVKRVFNGCAYAGVRVETKVDLYRIASIESIAKEGKNVAAFRSYRLGGDCELHITF
jgi:hypothetical protein